MATGFGQAILAFIILGLLYPPQLSTISATFPTHVRYAGFAISYNISTSLVRRHCARGQPGPDQRERGDELAPADNDGGPRRRCDRTGGHSRDARLFHPWTRDSRDRHHIHSGASASLIGPRQRVRRRLLSPWPRCGSAVTCDRRSRSPSRPNRPFDDESNCQDMNSLTGWGGANVEHASALNGPELTRTALNCTAAACTKSVFPGQRLCRA
jgi:hypothetical protein